MLDIGSPSANLATTPNYNSRRGCRSQFLNRGHDGHGRGRSQGYGQQQNNNSHFGNQQGNRPRITCQVCNCVGHSVLQCRQCFNHAFQPNSGVNLNAFHADHSSIHTQELPMTLLLISPLKIYRTRIDKDWQWYNFENKKYWFLKTHYKQC
ncbi:hypothetical protein AMTRI_Chr11g95830 [Amborella trichopoda]